MTTQVDQQRAASRWERFFPLLWTGLFVSLAGWVIHRLGLLPLASDVRVDTVRITEPRAFFTVDHPFHTARADLIARTWESFDTVRWVGSHQGGYPAEFFPFGVPGVAALIVLLTGQALTVATAWAFTIALLFLLPVSAYLLLSRHDRLSPAVAFVAFAAHVAIASDWMHGGFSELVEWGLATNVAGAVYALLAVPMLSRAAEREGLRWIPLTAIVITLCATSNPRSLIAVVIVAIAVVVRRAMVGDLRAAVRRVACVALLAVGISAPVVVPLLRYRDLYFFLSYQEYGSVAAYADATVAAMTWPVLLAALMGAVLAFWRSNHAAAQVCVMALMLYMGLTAMAASLPGLRELIPQLELPRLMPFQRLLTLYIAAYGVIRLITLVSGVSSRLARGRDLVVGVVLASALLIVFTTEIGPFPAHQQGLREVPRIEGAEAVEAIEFRAAIEEADAVVLPNTAILVLGSRLSWHRLNWHQQLWAPMSAESRRFLYNDWLWYWHTLHDGPYDYRSGHSYPNPSDALQPEYLEAHGVGAVVVMDVEDRRDGASARSRAARNTALNREATVGAWDVYRVSSPTTGLATINGAPADKTAVSGDFERIVLSFEDSEPGTLLVRQNWFPRWTATVNDEPVPVERGESGYLAIEVNGGPMEIELEYSVTTMDTIARGASMVSMVVIVLLVLGPRPISRWVRRLSSARSGSAHR
jgi:hypothetical protein